MRNAPASEKAPVGVFAGLATLDVIHRVAKAPAVNEKITSTAQFVAAGVVAAGIVLALVTLRPPRRREAVVGSELALEL